MANAYITLENESGSLKKKFKVLQGGYKPIEEKPTTMRQTVTGKIDRQTAQVVHRWEYTLKAYETDPDDPNGTDSDTEGYGTLEHLRTFFEYNQPGGYPSDDIKLTDNNGNVWVVRILNEMSENPLSVHIAGVNAEFHIPITMVEAYPRHDLKAAFTADNISLQDDQVLNLSYEGVDEGKLTVVKDDGGLRVVSNKLDFLPQISEAWGDLGVYGQDFSPTFGKALLGTLNMGAAREVAFGFNEGGDVDISAGNRRYVLFNDDGSIGAFYEDLSADVEVCGLWKPEEGLPTALVLGGFDANGVPWVPGKRRSDFERGAWCLVKRPTFSTFDKEDLLLYLPFEGKKPHANNFDVLTKDYFGRDPSTETGSIVGVEGKFGKDVSLCEGFTNEINDPVFGATTLTDNWTNSGLATFERSTAKIKYGTHSLHAVSDATADYCYSNTVANADGGETWTADVWVWVVSGDFKLTIEENNAGWSDADSATTSTTGEWVWVTITATLTAGVTDGRVKLGPNSTAASEFYVGYVGFHETGYSLPARYGDMPGATWTGTAHNSTTTVTESALEYDLDLMESFTVSCWLGPVTLPSETDSYSRVFRWESDGDNDVTIYYSPSTDRIQAVVKSAGNTTLLTHQDVERGTWYHIVFTKDGTDVVLYVDAEVADSDTHSHDFDNTTAQVAVGCNRSGSEQLNGSLDELAILSRALTAAEVEDIYDLGTPVLCDTAEWELVYVMPGGSTDPLYPVFSSYDGDGSLDDMLLTQIPLLVQRAVAFSDTFTDPDGIDLEDRIPDYDSQAAGWTVVSGVWAMSSNKATATTAGIATIDSGQSDLFLHAAVTTPGSGTDPCWILLRYSDDENYLGVRITPGTAGTDLELVEMESGSETVLDTADVDWSTSTEYDILVIAEEQNVRVLVDEVEKLHDTSDLNLDETECGLRDEGASNFGFDNVYVMPRTSTVYASEMEKEGY